MIGILCARSAGYSCNGEVYLEARSRWISVRDHPYLGIPNPDLQGSVFNVFQMNRIRPCPARMCKLRMRGHDGKLTCDLPLFDYKEEPRDQESSIRIWI
jgi:hypothetical protein